MNSYASSNGMIRKKQGHKLRLTDRVQLICLLYISVWVISPPLSYGDLYRIIAIAASLIWLSIELVSRPRNLITPSLPTFFAFFFIFYTAIIDLILYETKDILQHFQTYVFLLFLIFYESYSKRDIRHLRIVFWVSLVLLSIWSLITIKEMLIYPHVARLLVRSSPMAEYYMAKGVGGYGLVYSVVVVIPILAYFIRSGDVNLYFKRQNFIKKIFAHSLIILCFLICLTVIIMAGYTIATVLMAGSILIFLMVKGDSLTSMCIAATISILIILLFGFFSDSFINSMSELSTGTQYEKKLQDITHSIEIERSVGTVSTRSERYIRSIKLLFENPFFGTLEFTDIGKHSSILDKFARYGIFIGAIFAYTVFYLPLRYIKYVSSNFGLVFAIIFITIGFSFLNNITMSFGFMIFIFYPVAMTYVREQKSGYGRVAKLAAQ